MTYNVTLLMNSLVNFEPEILYYGPYGIPHASSHPLKVLFPVILPPSSLAIKAIFMLTFFF
jgi:hypothetical protein